jgi:predicted nuclease with RNAse H fold
MTVTVPGCTTLTGRPATILRLLRDANVIESGPLAALDCEDADKQADMVLRELARDSKITIEEE